MADLYMRSFEAHPDLSIAQVYDRDPERLSAFCNHWDLASVDTLDAFFDALPPGSLVLNLTNPSAHYELNKACLTKGHHVYSEKPLALEMQDARKLVALADQNALLLASAPCSVLGEAAQTLGKAIRDGVAGRPRVIYAELDDGFLPQAPYQDWKSASGAPWPALDEFRTGCTLEHAGYYLAWLIAIFGPIERVVAASAHTISDLLPEGSAPDTSIATLRFDSGLIARLTCSIVAPHDHRIRVIGDKGVLTLKEAWDNSANVRFHKRINIRRKLIDLPIGKAIRLGGETHPKVARWGAAEMNFALGCVEMLEAIKDKRPCRLSSAFSLHLTEVTLAIQNAGPEGIGKSMTTRCEPMEPMPWAR